MAITMQQFRELAGGDIVHVKNCPVPCTVIRTPVFSGAFLRTDCKPRDGTRTLYGITCGSITRILDTAEDEVTRRER